MRVQLREGRPGEAFLFLACAGERRKGLECQFRLAARERKDRAGCVWAWDGNVDRPTITPSIHCLGCGLHTTITKGTEVPARKTGA